VIAEPLCVLCHRRPADDTWRPFCSERCKRQDLARWLDGVYRVPGESAPARDAAPDADENDDRRTENGE
jgi:hypothetical protein